MNKICTKRAANISQQIFLTALIITFLYFGVLALKSFTTPVSTIKGSREMIYQQIEHDFKVYPVDSILYPSGTEPLLPGEKSFFTALTKKIEFQVTGKVEADAYTGLESDFTVSLTLLSEGQWEKQLPFQPGIKVSQAEDGVMLYSASFELPLKEARELGEMIIKETQVRPREGFTLMVRSNLRTSLPEEGGMFPEESVVQGEYRFNIVTPFIIPNGELFCENVTVRTKNIPMQNHVRPMGLPLPVSLARFLFPALAALSGFGAVAYFLQFEKNRRTSRSTGEWELDKIRKRYGGRLVRAGAIKAPEDAFRVELNDYTEMSKVADETEKPIIEVVYEKNLNKIQAGFYVLDGKTLYVYKYYASC